MIWDKSRLRDLIGSVRGTDKFAFSTKLDDPINPGLHLKDFGVLSLPVSKHVADAVFEHYQKLHPDSTTQQSLAIFGEDEFEIVNPRWPNTLDDTQSRLKRCHMLG